MMHLHIADKDVPYVDQSIAILAYTGVLSWPSLRLRQHSAPRRPFTNCR
jgi:hypothetical protein